jgi:hypothetical protein
VKSRKRPIQISQPQKLQLTVLSILFVGSILITTVQWDLYPITWMNLLLAAHCAVLSSLLLSKLEQQSAQLNVSVRREGVAAAAVAHRFDRLEGKVNLILVATAEKPPKSS